MQISFQKIFFITCCFISFWGVQAEEISDRIEQIRKGVARDATLRLQAVLDRYCAQHCQILDVQVDVHETFADSDDLGFEGTQSNVADSKLEVQAVRPLIQIDSRVLSQDRNKLETLLKNKLKGLAIEQAILWETVELPTIGQHSWPTDELEQQTKNKLQKAIQTVIDRYCPDQCLLDGIEINTVPITPDQMVGLTAGQIIRGARNEGGLRIQGIQVSLTFDEALVQEERDRILRLMQAQTRFIEPLSFQPNITAFPEPASQKKRRSEELATDPYGLEKLRQMLIMFRELAGTKEVIQTQTVESKSKSESNQNMRSDSNQESRERVSLESEINSDSKLSESMRKSETNSSKQEQSQYSIEELAAYGAGLLFLLVLILLLVIKFSSNQRMAHEMIMASQAARSGQSGHSHPIRGAGFFNEPGEQSHQSPSHDQMLANSSEKAHGQIRLSQMKEDLIKQLMDHPAVARETFSRLLKDDGVAETAKYVAIFGQLIVFELLNDVSLKRELYELSEFYHRSNFKFDIQTEMALLDRLKTMTTASEIRLLSNHSSDRFDFLSRLDGQQIFNLMKDEHVRVQSIVLTQLDRKMRSSVFDLYEGDAKVRLLEELSQAKSIPREFLSNVAQALHKKVQNRSEFDTENLRSSDILLDLFEKANLSEQKRLMRTLERNNRETARALKLKLVTVEILPYLKDGQLLEVIFGMERGDLLAFLIGVSDHIRDVILQKAPRELAESWIEDIRNLSGSDENSYRVAEMKVKSRIRSMANNGMISLLDINDILFRVGNEEDTQNEDEYKRPGSLSKGSLVA